MTNKAWIRRLAEAVAVGSTALTVALSVGIVPAAAAHPGHGDTQQLFYDDFREGFDSTGTDATWYTARDGVPTTSIRGLTVVPEGTNPATGDPAFTYTTGQEADGGDGFSDQAKWGALVNHTSSNGYHGWDITAGSTFRCEVKLSARTYGTQDNPFGSLVSDPQSDLRLAAATMQASDPETGAVFTYFVTNTVIYAAYARQPQAGATYASFFYAIPVRARTPDQQNSLAIQFTKDTNTVRWQVDGQTVLSMHGQIGQLAFPRRYLLTDHGGTPTTVSPRQLYCGFSYVTFLDGAGADGNGLVRLSSQSDFYYNTLAGAPAPSTFYDEHSLAGNRLWGQGIKIQVDHVSVTSTTG